MRTSWIALLGAFVAALPAELAQRTHVWSDVEGTYVADAFFENFHTPESAWKVNAQTIAGYIRNRVAHGELRNWTVALVSIADRADDDAALSSAARK